MSRDRAHARRSQLFVPATRPDFVPSALKCGADAFILDLEDGVSRGSVDPARARLPEMRAALGADGRDVYVRVNSDFRLLLDDLDAVAEARPTGVVLSKVEDVRSVHAVDALLGEREARRGLGHPLEIQVLIESCAGLANTAEILASSSRIVSTSLGLEDLALDLGADPDGPGSDWSWAHGQVLLAARRCGIAPYGLVGSVSNFADLGRFAQDVERSRRFGYVGVSCIHPSQVQVVNVCFTPGPDEVARAQEIVRTFRAADAAGRGAVGFGGWMIDAPVVERARRLLRRAAAGEEADGGSCFPA